MTHVAGNVLIYCSVLQLHYIMAQIVGDVLTLHYWAPGDGCWGHTALTLSDGTHISWWPSTQIGANKSFPGLVPVAVVSIL